MVWNLHNSWISHSWIKASFLLYITTISPTYYKIFAAFWRTLTHYDVVTQNCVFLFYIKRTGKCAHILYVNLKNNNSLLRWIIFVKRLNDIDFDGCWLPLSVSVFVSPLLNHYNSGMHGHTFNKKLRYREEHSASVVLSWCTLWHLSGDKQQINS